MNSQIARTPPRTPAGRPSAARRRPTRRTPARRSPAPGDARTRTAGSTTTGTRRAAPAIPPNGRAASRAPARARSARGRSGLGVQWEVRPARGASGGEARGSPATACPRSRECGPIESPAARTARPLARQGPAGPGPLDATGRAAARCGRIAAPRRRRRRRARRRRGRGEVIPASGNEQAQERRWPSARAGRSDTDVGEESVDGRLRGREVLWVFKRTEVKSVFGFNGSEGRRGCCRSLRPIRGRGDVRDCMYRLPPPRRLRQPDRVVHRPRPDDQRRRQQLDQHDEPQRVSPHRPNPPAAARQPHQRGQHRCDHQVLERPPEHRSLPGHALWHTDAPRDTGFQPVPGASGVGELQFSHSYVACTGWKPVSRLSLMPRTTAHLRISPLDSVTPLKFIEQPPQFRDVVRREPPALDQRVDERAGRPVADAVGQVG